MLAEEIARLPAKTVRNDEKLMRLYIEKYKDVFRSEPNCASCSFNSDFAKFKSVVLKRTKFINSQKSSIMSKYTLKRKHANDILTYRKKNEHGREVPVRVYGRKVTDEFAEEFLKNGTKEQIAARKKMFEETAPKAKNPKAAEASAKGQSNKAANADKNAAKKDAKVVVENSTVKQLEAQLQEITDVKELETLLSLEKNSDEPRKTAIAAIEARIAEVSETKE